MTTQLQLIDLLKVKYELAKKLKEIVAKQTEILNKQPAEEVMDDFQKSLNFKEKIISDINAADSLINKQRALSDELGTEIKVTQDMVKLSRQIEEVLKQVHDMDEQNLTILSQHMTNTREERKRNKESIKAQKKYTNMSRNSYVDQAFFFDQKS